MRRTVFRGILGALVGVMVLAPPANADESKKGSCSGSGHWELRIARESSTELRIRFLVRNVEAGSTWQVFLSDNDHRILATSRTANEEGRFRVRVVTRDRAGRDHVEASAVEGDSGQTCTGSIRF